MAYQVEPLCGPHTVGEGPHWDQDRQNLYYVDPFETAICRYSPTEKKLYKCKVGSQEKDHVSIVIPVKGKPDKFLVTLRNQLAVVKWDGVSTTPSNVRVLTSVDNEPGLEKNIFNDGKVDPTGRLWVGTVASFDNLEDIWGKAVGSLYSFSETLSPSKKASGIIMTNGLAWSPDLKFMYYIDTAKKSVDVFDYDSGSGSISNRRVAFDFTTVEDIPKGNTGPDGMTIDQDGNLWVAVFGGSGVYQIDPRVGKLLRKVELPCPQVTSVAFGGPNLDELYVVTATLLMDDKLPNFPYAGYAFRVTGLGVKGTPMLPIDLSKIPDI